MDGETDGHTDIQTNKSAVRLTSSVQKHFVEDIKEKSD